MQYEDSMARLNRLIDQKGRSLHEFLEIKTFSSQAFENLYTDICQGAHNMRALS